MGVGLHNIHSTIQYRLAGSQRPYKSLDIERFWAKVDTSGDCWLWLASRMDKMGHGQFTCRFDGTQHHLYAHRVVWELTHGPIPDGLVICHHCDVPPCVNPAHLFVGTQADNLADARRKLRLIDGVAARKLSDEAYRDILTQPYTRGSGIALARKHGVHKGTISRIRRGRQGAVYHRDHPPVDAVFERVASVKRPVVGELHVGSLASRASSLAQDSRKASRACSTSTIARSNSVAAG